jgi:hypothetical protein
LTENYWHLFQVYNQLGLAFPKKYENAMVFEKDIE